MISIVKNKIINMCNSTNIIFDILISIFSAYLFIILLKIYFLFSIRNSLKPHVHSKAKPDLVVFCIRYDWSDFFTPVPRICLIICRTNGDDNENWQGKYFSDMLNPYKLTGVYFKDRESPSENDLGWHELILFPKQQMIALVLNYIENNEGKKSWKSTDGYFIYKRDNCH